MNLIGTLILFTLLISYILYREAFYFPNNTDKTYEVLSGPDYDPYHDQMIALIDKAVQIPFEPVSITSYDGLKLYGRIYKGKEGNPVHIQFHGYKGRGIRDFAGGLQLTIERGDNVIVIDHRSHGDSEGHVISFGVKERYDVLSWCEFAEETFGEDSKIFLEGVSMGAATVLMASDLELPTNVKGILADCPYDSPTTILKTVAKQRVGDFLGELVIPFFAVGAYLFGHFKLFDSSAIKSVVNTKVPILIIHGTWDHFVPIEMSRNLKDSNPKMIRMVEIEGAPHGLSYFRDFESYKKEFNRFVNELI